MRKDEFITNLCEYFQEPDNILNHIDISGMNFDRDSIFKICSALSQNENLLCIHLSDNGLRKQ